MQFQSETEWRAWKKARVLQLQRERRASLRRIDFYPSEAAVEIIDANLFAGCGGDYSSVISRIIEEWAQAAIFRN